MSPAGESYDLLVIGGGIVGAGVARDAAGRGLSVLLCEQGDLAGATSSASSKLIHGGLRYLEHRRWRLVREALAERSLLLAAAPHLVRPLRFVLPLSPASRSSLSLRLGLFLYDRMASGGGDRPRLPKSEAVALDPKGLGRGLRPGLTRGFAYSDCWGDDARLVVANARAAADRGARILVRTAVAQARREAGGWLVALWDRDTRQGRSVSARAIVNAAGPWAAKVLGEVAGEGGRCPVRLIKGSHIVVPRLHDGEHAFLLQADDGRVVFVVPFEARFSLIGTTDVPFAGDPTEVRIDAGEIEYLCRVANAHLARRIGPEDVVWSYSGVRTLFDDGTSEASRVSRDDVLRVADEGGAAPIVTVLGGKLTTYRRIAERVLDRLAHCFPGMQGDWTAAVPLPGGDLPAVHQSAADVRAPAGALQEDSPDLAEGEAGAQAVANTVLGVADPLRVKVDPSSPQAQRERLSRLRLQLGREYPRIPAGQLAALVHRHGTLTSEVLGDSKTLADLGARFGPDLYEREVEHCVRREWARSGEDVLWRRTKAGLHLDEAGRASVDDCVRGILEKVQKEGSP